MKQAGERLSNLLLFTNIQMGNKLKEKSEEWRNISYADASVHQGSLDGLLRMKIT